MRRRPHPGLINLLFYVIFVILLRYLQSAFPAVFNSRVLVSTLAALPLTTVAAGFLYRLRPVAGVLLPPVAENQPVFSLDGITAQSFLQGITYEVSMKNLWLLAIAPLISFGLWAAVSLHWIARANDNPAPLYLAVLAVGGAMFLAMRWRHERKLLHMNCSGFGQILGVGKSEVSYQFFDPRGGRRGGIARFTKPVAAGDLAPIFVDKDRPDDSRLFASFWFFRFRIVDCRHIPPGKLGNPGEVPKS